jgi:hypothetical protein
MDNRFLITVCSDRFHDEILLETQGDLAMGELLPDILKILNWPIAVDGKTVHYSLRTEDKTLGAAETLASAGVVNFDPLWISPGEADQGEAAQAAPPQEGQLDLRDIAPYWTRIPVESPALIHPDGYMLILDTPPVLIGRHGGDEPVQVDLSEFEKGRLISSRRHARIVCEHEEYYLQAFKTRNGTFIGRDELQPGESRRLKNNDVIQFGSGGVRLVFRKP